MATRLPRRRGGQEGPLLSQLSRLSGQRGLGQSTLMEEEEEILSVYFLVASRRTTEIIS